MKRRGLMCLILALMMLPVSVLASSISPNLGNVITSNASGAVFPLGNQKGRQAFACLPLLFCSVAYFA